MFRKMTVICIVAFSFLALIWGVQTFVVRESDISAYQKLMRIKEIAASPKSLSSSTNQTRQGVRKDIWFTQEDKSRLHYRIESASSLLSLQPKGHHFEIIENLEKIKCWMQDKLYLSADESPMQQMRYFEADAGTYRYTTQQFLAQTVALSLFRLPGHELELSLSSPPFIKGIAHDVSFSISGKSTQFQASNFKAQFKK